ncbi:branched-chain-amino-acid transaminase [Euzebya tangerina]|uniref:branched-chain-amino-acid transaminase n=1 Tax=Euzebya tangerina TaxID=591198 RepID=UPI000E31F603|nr:branched-chain-amino-acid transaminase [Euzebya tangerina]
MAAAFGSVFAGRMGITHFAEGSFEVPELIDTGELTLSPAAHALHYGSSCFEGLKAHKGADGVTRIFRLDAHVERMRRSAELLMLPVPSADLLSGLISDVVAANLDDVPDAPGALYLRPVLLGTEPNIGAAARPSSTALLYVLASPVGDYFDSSRTLTVAVETELPRTTPQFGRIKTGANYAMALGVTLQAKAEHEADQVLFAPGGIVQETGAANFLMIAGDTVVTRALDASFLHGVTRDSVLTLAADHGLTVEERDLSVDELAGKAGACEAVLSGTAAVLAPIGHLVIDGKRLEVGDGEMGPHTRELREALLAIQRGQAEDAHGWTRPVGA